MLVQYINTTKITLIQKIKQKNLSPFLMLFMKPSLGGSADGGCVMRSGMRNFCLTSGCLSRAT